MESTLDAMQGTLNDIKKVIKASSETLAEIHGELKQYRSQSAENETRTILEQIDWQLEELTKAVRKRNDPTE